MNEVYEYKTIVTANIPVTLAQTIDREVTGGSRSDKLITVLEAGMKALGIKVDEIAPQNLTRDPAEIDKAVKSSKKDRPTK